MNLNNDKHYSCRALCVVILLLLLGASPVAFAEPVDSDTDELTVEVELAAPFSLSCGTLDFGRIAIPLGPRSQTNTFRFDPDSDVLRQGSSNFGSNTGPASSLGGASPATCVISGLSGITVGNEIKGSIVGADPGTNTGPFNSFSFLLTEATGPNGPITPFDGELEVGFLSISTLTQPGTGSLSTQWTGSPILLREVQEGDTTHSFTIRGEIRIGPAGSSGSGEFLRNNAGVYTGSITIQVEEHDPSV